MYKRAKEGLKKAVESQTLAWTILGAAALAIGVDVGTFTENPDAGILGGIAALVGGAIIADKYFEGSFLASRPQAKHA